MKLSPTLKRIIVSGAIVSALALVFTAIMPDTTYAHGGPGGNFGRGGLYVADTHLATALGITVEDLQAAEERASSAALAQAVEEGLITQYQADLMANRGGFPGRGIGPMGRFGFGNSTIDYHALLAQELGISVDDLQAARETAATAALAAAVQDGRITQDQADELTARRSLRNYFDTIDLRSRMRSVFEEAVRNAVEAGIISEERAEQILENQNGPGMRGFDMRRPGGRGHGMRGFEGPGWGGPFQTPNNAPAPSLSTSSYSL